MALLLPSRAAFAAREWEELNVRSAQALALADPHSWVAAEAQFMQAQYWSMIDPPRGDRLFEGFFEMEARIGISPDQVAYQFFYLSRLRRANDREEAFALLSEWLAHLDDATDPSPGMVAVFALYGDIQTALQLKARAEWPDLPILRFLAELSEAVLASAQGQFDEAEQHLATMSSFQRDFAGHRMEVPCLIGFANVALDRGDYARASRLLAAVDSGVGREDRLFRTGFDALIYAHCTAVLQEVLDPESARTTQIEGSALSPREALDAELIRSGAMAMSNPAY
jgi:hypothetical protein